MRVEEAIQQFREAAIRKAEADLSTAEDHALYSLLKSAWRAIEGHGPAGRAVFAALLDDESIHVRGWAAAQLLALGDERAAPVLEADSQAEGLVGFAATIVLKEWRAGRLKPPLGQHGA
jgi:hypothetical protein